MNPSEFIGKFKSRYLWGNLLAMLIVVVLLCVGVKVALDVYTHHGESVTIPDVRRKSFDDARYMLEQAGMEVQVTDTGYVRNLPPNSVLEQSPMAGEKVKTGHVVTLIINATHSPTITVPDVIDNSSLREAMAKLTAMGFKLTAPKYIPGEKDWVYALVVKGRHVQTGDKVSVDDAITIEVGNGQVDSTMDIDYTDAPADFGDEVIEMGNATSGDVDDFHEVHGPVGE